MSTAECTFQSTPSQRGRLRLATSPLQFTQFQSTPSQRGRRVDWEKATKKLYISIHALAKRATLAPNSSALLLDISIHALAKRATVSFIVGLLNYGISIHALAKRATKYPLVNQRFPLDFNPRPRKEGDPIFAPILSFFVVFQSTPSQRGRLTSRLSRLPQKYFNPRPRKEGDSRKFTTSTKAKYFNPRPRKEGDFTTVTARLLTTISIHALAKRATTVLLDVWSVSAYFNPRPRKEGDVARFALRVSFSVFQSTPSQRGRPMAFENGISGYVISIHALAKRATFCRLCACCFNCSFQSTPSQRGRQSCTAALYSAIDISIHALAKRATDRVRF